jgi:oligopeptide/dipeptide ABC transporter ATP-binding protein
MYAGQVVEDAPTRDLFKNPKHPYTKGLFASLPARNRRGQDLATLEGIVPDPAAWPKACRFAERCAYRWESCVTIPPKEWPPEIDRPCRCHLYDPEIPGRPNLERAEKAHVAGDVTADIVTKAPGEAQPAPKEVAPNG